MRIDTVKGGSYVVTCTGACIVQALRSDASSIVLLEAAKAGQYGFVAPTDAVEVSDEGALVVRTFSGAALGLPAQGGIQPGSDVVLGSLTAQGGTFSATINANGGVNIPLATSPTTPTSGINRLVASGLSFVSDAFSPQSYLSSSEIYGNKVSVQQTVPGLCWLLRNSAPMSAPVPGTVKVIYISPFSGVCNYSGWRGFLLPIMLGNNGGRIARKLTFFIGTISLSQCVVSTAADIDIFTLSPKSGQVLSFARIIDVTFYMTSDSTLSPEGYPVRVRELIYDKESARYMVHTTVSVIPSFNNNPSGNMFISYQQADLSAANPAGLWIGSNGYDGRRLLRIANLHAVRDTFNYMGTNSMYWDCGAGDSYIGSLRHVMAPGNNQQNGAYHAFTALETKLFQSTSTEEFVHYE